VAPPPEAGDLGAAQLGFSSKTRFEPFWVDSRAGICRFGKRRRRGVFGVSLVAIGRRRRHQWWWGIPAASRISLRGFERDESWGEGNIWTLIYYVTQVSRPFDQKTSTVLIYYP